MDKEKIKKFDKEQLELLLNDLQDIDKFTGFKDGAFRYELGKYQANLLVNCIKKQKEIIDKAVEYIRKNRFSVEEFISIIIANDSQIQLPNFKKNTMYKGMETEKEYTLKELGLDE